MGFPSLGWRLLSSGAHRVVTDDPEPAHRLCGRPARLARLGVVLPEHDGRDQVPLPSKLMTPSFRRSFFTTLRAMRFFTWAKTVSSNPAGHCSARRRYRVVSQ